MFNLNLAFGSAKYNGQRLGPELASIIVFFPGTLLSRVEHVAPGGVNKSAKIAI